MALKEKIQEDLKGALKKTQKSRVMVLRLLLASILNKEKEKRYKIIKAEPELTEKELKTKAKLTDEEIIETISSEIKKRKEAILEFSAYGGPAAGREKDKIENFIKKEKQEIEILQEYMPEQLSVKELKKLAKEVIEKVEAKELKDMGKVMGELMPKVKGRAEGSQVSKIVKELLSAK